MRSSGILLCLASAVAFGAMGIFGKLAYDEGATVATLLAVRFATRGDPFWALAVGSARSAACARIPRRDLGIALALGALGYSAQAGCYFAALERLDASLLSLRRSTPSRRSSRSPRSSLAASGRAAGRRRPFCSRRWAWCSCWRARRRERWTRWERHWAWRPR